MQGIFYALLSCSALVLDHLTLKSLDLHYLGLDASYSI